MLLAGVYKVAGVEHGTKHERVVPARILGIVIGTLIVLMTGVVARQLWGRKVSLLAMAGAAVYIPLILVGASVMSEPLFALLLLGALAAAIQHRRSTHRWRWVVLAGVLAGLTCLTRANALVLLLPLGLAVWTVRPRFSVRALAAPALLVVLALLTISPWTIRNAVTFHRFIPVSTQLGSALAGTYNDQARLDKQNPASWRAIMHIPEFSDIYARLKQTPEPVVEDELRARSKAYIRKHPGYVLTVAEWTSLRMLDLGGLDWSRHTASTISVTARLGDRGRDLLLGVRAARRGGRVHQARAAHADVRLADPDPALPERGLPGRRDAALPDGDRPVHRHARGAGATTSTSRRRGPWTPSTRSSSMSEVADGPETSVIGRPARGGLGERARPRRAPRRRSAPRARRRRGGRARA